MASEGDAEVILTQCDTSGKKNSNSPNDEAGFNTDTRSTEHLKMPVMDPCPSTTTTSMYSDEIAAVTDVAPDDGVSMKPLLECLPNKEISRPRVKDSLGKQNSSIIEGAQRRLTYADVVKLPKQTPKTKSKPTTTGVSITKDIQSNVDVGAIRKIPRRVFRSQRPVAIPKKRRPLLKLIGVSAYMNNQKLLEAIFEHNTNLLDSSSDVKIVRRIMLWGKCICNVILEVTPATWRSLKDKPIRLGQQIVKAIDQSPVVQCFKCLTFDHEAWQCTGQTTCGYCSGAHHTLTCRRDMKPRCVNCNNLDDKKGHPAYGPVCPIWQMYDRLARSDVQYY